MRKILALLTLALLLPLAVSAQDTPGTVKYPAAADSADSLIRATNSARSTLTGAVTNSAATLTVVSAASFPASGAAMIDSEIIFYTGKTSSTLTGVVRGADGTTAASHASGAAVRGVVTAAHHNTLAQAVTTVEAKVGTGGSTPSAGTVLTGTGPGASAWGQVPSAALPTNPALSGNASVSGNLSVGGVITGNCAGCTGITGATGGVSNTGSTTVRADSDSDGVGIIDLQTKDGVTGLRVNNDATVEAPAGGKIPDRGAQVYNVRAFGALCDGSTDDYTAIQNTVNVAAASGGGNIVFPGVCTTSHEIVLTKGFTVSGTARGAGPYRRTTFTGTAVLRYRPTAFPDNEGLTIRDLTISSVDARQNPANDGEWDCAACSTVHGLWLDPNGAPTTANIENVSITNSKFLPVGGYAIYAPDGGTGGVPAKSTLENNLYYGGLYFGALGDSVQIIGGKSVGKNYAIDASQILGATQFQILDLNMTNPAGVIFRGPFERLQLIGGIYEIYKDYSGTVPACPSGAVITLEGSAGQRMSGAIIRGAHVSALNGMPCDAIKINYSDSAHLSDNTLNTPVGSGKKGIIITSNAASTIIGENVTRGGAAAAGGYVSDSGTGTRYDGFLYASAPSSNALGAGLQGHLSIVGFGQFGAGARVSITPGAAGLGSYFFNESGTDAGEIKMPAAAFSDPSRVRYMEFETKTNGAGFNFRTTTGGTTAARWTLSAAGDFESLDSARGLILKAPGGTRYRLKVDNAGAVTTEVVP